MAKAAQALQAAKRFVEFVNETGSPYHSVAACAKTLTASGFQELKEGNTWAVKAGGKYFVTKNGSDVMAFVVGGKFKADGDSGFSIVGAHTDSPCLRLRPNSKMGGSGMLQVGIQTYGGGLWHTWFDRPLGFAGKVVVKAGGSGQLVEHLIRVTKPVMLIPNLAIHLRDDSERKAFSPNTEANLQPILCSKMFDEAAATESSRGEEPKEGPMARHHMALLEMVAKEVGCQPSEIIDADLCLMDALPASIVGLYEEFISAPRIDNQLSTWAAVQGLCDFSSAADKVAESRDVLLAVAFDHEEVGSLSATGADGATLPGWLERILDSLTVGASVRPEIYARSFMVSADCAHGVHPNYSGKHQSEHRPEFHKGIVIKTNANQRYSTTPLTAALLREVCTKASVPLQDFVVRNDSPCGTTIGPITSARTGIRSIDVGAAQWAMHSCRESCATSDAGHLLDLCKGFFELFRDVDTAASKV